MSESAQKKVFFVVTKGNFGGAQRYVYDLATNLPQGWHATVAAGGPPENLLFKKLTVHRISTVPLPHMVRDIGIVKEIKAFFTLYHLFKAARPDVVHLNSPKAGGLGALAARFAQVPRIIYTAHGWPFWEDRPWYQKILIYFFSYLTVLLSHATICISRADAQSLRYFPGASSRIHTIYNGVTSPTFLSRETVRAQYFSEVEQAAHTDDFWVVSVAEMTKNKNLAFALEAVAAYNQTHERRIFYTIMGTGELEATLKEKATALLPNHIHFAGFIPDAVTTLQGFHCLFLPSIKEGVPYALLEAQCAGIPVVASRVGGIPEIATAHDTLIDPKNIQSAVHALERASCTSEHHPRCEHTLERMVRETLEVY